ncbi:MAG TPA: DUF748 domain-containing protein [Chitinophagaceae bacterium]|nr:DUF748 domain-containing protein [Chitinophagaceae bacterium]
MAKRGKKRKIRIWWIVLGSLLIILIAARLALPYILLRVVNKELTRIPGYQGHVNEIDVSLFRGAYTLEIVKLDKTGGKVPVPFFSATTLDLSIQWKGLLHHRIVGQIIVGHPILNFVKGPTKATSQTRIDSSWISVLSKLMPLKVNHFEIIGGEIHYRDYFSKPKVDLYTKNVHIVASNLSNVNQDKNLLPSNVTGTADMYGGHASLNMRINAMDSLPTFEVKAKLLGLDLTKLNNFLQAYANFDVKQGILSIYTEAAAKEGLINGYAMPFIKNLKVVNWKQDKKNPLRLAWEAVIGATAWIFKNHRLNQLATRATFEGDIKNPDVDIWYIIGQTLRNAFIQALYPSLENSVTLNTIHVNKHQKPTWLSKQYSKTQKK